MGGDVSPQHILRDLQRGSLDDDVLDAPDKVRVCAPPHQSVGLLVSADEEAVVGVGGGDAGDADAGLREGAVHGQSHHILGLHS